MILGWSEKSRAYAAYQYQSSTIAMSRAWLATFSPQRDHKLAISLQFVWWDINDSYLKKIKTSQDNRFKMGSSILYNVSSCHHWSLKKWPWHKGSIHHFQHRKASGPERPFKPQGVTASGNAVGQTSCFVLLKVDMLLDLLVMMSESPFKKKTSSKVRSIVRVNLDSSCLVSGFQAVSGKVGMIFLPILRGNVLPVPKVSEMVASLPCRCGSPWSPGWSKSTETPGVSENRELN